MARKLLLLGMLRMQEMHGYQINEFIDVHLGTSIQLKKPTVYKLLGVMEGDGWINSREEREGNYPPRRVYAITETGESAFQELLRANIADYQPASYLGNIGIVYLDALPIEEAAILLAERRKKVNDMLVVLDDHEMHTDGFDLMLSYQRHLLSAELAWLDGIIDRETVE
jgi:DNA-binding PadR family transcriptional regulator